MEDTRKIMLFEQVPVPRAVAQLAVPTILSSLVMVLYNLAETIRICTVLLQPFMPETCVKIFAQLGTAEELRTWFGA